MLKLLSRPAAFLLILSFALANCSKDDDDEPKSKTTLLTQREWVITKFEEKVNNNPYVDDFPNWDACDKDDRYVFKTDHTYEFNEGPSKCDPADPQIYDTGSWAFTDNETKLTIGSDSYNIDQLDDNTLVISQSEVVAPDTYYLKITFGH